MMAGTAFHLCQTLYHRYFTRAAGLALVLILIVVNLLSHCFAISEGSLSLSLSLQRLLRSPPSTSRLQLPLTQRELCTEHGSLSLSLSPSLSSTFFGAFSLPHVSTLQLPLTQRELCAEHMAWRRMLCAWSKHYHHAVCIARNINFWYEHNVLCVRRRAGDQHTIYIIIEFTHSFTVHVGLAQARPNNEVTHQDCTHCVKHETS